MGECTSISKIPLQSAENSTIWYSTFPKLPEEHFEKLHQ